MTRENELQTLEEFEKYANVAEQWSIYDSIVICSQFYGSEATVPGWFTTFALFGQHERHSLFKNRTRSTAGAQYNNMKNADTMDFAFRLESIGLEIMGPPLMETVQEAQDGNGVGPIDAILPQWFKTDLVRHMGIEFRVQQDTRVELPAMACPAGAGAIGGGVAFDVTSAVAPAFGDIPFITNQVTQGVPLLKNRYPIPDPIGIPRNSTIEGVLHLSNVARVTLQNILGPRQFQMNSADGAAPFNFFYSRYIIRMSLIGQRLVQQRAQYHR